MITFDFKNTEESLSIAWCDNGLVDGKFTEGLAHLVLYLGKSDLKLNEIFRVQGNQISRQRQIVFDHWIKNTTTDWLFWIDSDVYVSIDNFKLLWNTAHKIEKPIVTGVYFVSKSTDYEVMQPLPVIFNNIDEKTIEYIHPLPENQVIEVDSSGMGFVLMHRSVGITLQNKFLNEPVFAEKLGLNNDFVGEDIAFFRKVKEAGIPIYAHTGATAKHMKRFPLDINYYQAYWNIKKPE